MAKNKSKKRAPTEWSEWVYDYDRGCYASSRINEDGVRKFAYGGACPPPVEGLEEQFGQISLSPDEPETNGDVIATQAGRMFSSSGAIETPSSQLANGTSAGYPPYSTNPGSLPYSEGQTSPAYAASYGASQSGPALTRGSAGGYHSSTGYGANAMSAAGSMSGNPIPQSHNSSPLPTDFRWAPPTGPANNSQRTRTGHRSRSGMNSNVVGEENTRTDHLPKIELFKGKLPILYVFAVVWTEPNGHGNGTDRDNASFYSLIHPTKYKDELAYTSIRRFVICKEQRGHSSCLPILTYGKRATTKSGVKPEHHAIIYTAFKNPQNSRQPPDEVEGESYLPNTPIRVVPTKPRHQLDPRSRLNYAKVYTVEHNIRVSFLGNIHKDSLEEFQTTFDRIFNGGITDGGMNGDDDGADIHPDNTIYQY
ncbi:hypothetical protein V493_06635 [Pseudogymnoascus sp. VKM F-4281 (FW-2241)]|nr:hypothetical protein V493_06635 [Pseudogymnoascus sp. VKM F-4281 (FW-2241)]